MICLSNHGQHNSNIKSTLLQSSIQILDELRMLAWPPTSFRWDYFWDVNFQRRGNSNLHSACTLCCCISPPIRMLKSSMRRIMKRNQLRKSPREKKCYSSVNQIVTVAPFQNGDLAKHLPKYTTQLNDIIASTSREKQSTFNTFFKPI